MFDQAVLERLLAAADDPGGVAGDELGQLVLDAQRVVSQLQAAAAELTSEWDRRMAWADDGGTSGGAWLAHRGQVGRSEASGDVRLARRLAAMPATMAALDDGELGMAKARLLASARRGGLVDAFDAAEASLVAVARDLTVDQVARLVRHWMQVHQPDGGASAAAAERDGAHVHLSQTYAGRWVLNGVLDPEQGAVLDRRLRDVDRELWEADREAHDVPRRTASQRRAEALVLLADRSEAADAMAADRLPRPQLLAVCDLGILYGEQHEPAVPGAICEIEGVGPAPADALRRLACNAAITDVALGADGSVLAVGRTRRLATPAQRKALLLRDRGCRFPGCDRNGAWCEAHHVDHYEHGGATDLPNLVLLCGRHHHLVHEGGFGLARRPDGTLGFTRPGGSPIHTLRPNHVPLRMPLLAR